MGEQRYPDGAAYKEQFANGFEHGQGSMTYPDRSCFEGRFRFGGMMALVSSLLPMVPPNVEILKINTFTTILKCQWIARRVRAKR